MWVIRPLPAFQASEEFRVDASLEETWKFISDISNVGHCIPGCEDVRQIDETTALFKIKFKVGYLSKTFELKVKILERIADVRLKFTASGQDAEIAGSLELNSLEAAAKPTTVKYIIGISAISMTGKTALAMLGNDTVKKQTSEFASCVKAKLGGATSA